MSHTKISGAHWLLQLPQGLWEELNDEFDYQYSESWAAYADLLQQHGYPLGGQIAEEQRLYLQDPAAVEPWIEPELCDEFDPTKLDDPDDFMGNYPVHGFSGSSRYGYQRTLELKLGTTSEPHLFESFLGEERCRFLKAMSVWSNANAERVLEVVARSTHGLPWLEELHLYWFSVNATRLSIA